MVTKRPSAVAEAVGGCMRIKLRLVPQTEYVLKLETKCNPSWHGSKAVLHMLIENRVKNRVRTVETEAERFSLELVASPYLNFTW